MECRYLSATYVKGTGFQVRSPTSFLSCQHSGEYSEGLTKCQKLYENVPQETHHLVKELYCIV